MEKLYFNFTKINTLHKCFSSFLNCINGAKSHNNKERKRPVWIQNADNNSNKTKIIEKFLIKSSSLFSMSIYQIIKQ